MLLYLHIPYCDSKCHYCSFNSYTTQHATQNQYMEAILAQLEYDLEIYNVQKNSITSVFIGGGTPSVVNSILYEKFFSRITPFLSVDAEITTEANPNSASLGWLSGMQSLGVNRVSFGVQTFDEKKLQALGRAHTRQEAIKAIENSAKAGFENISMDLIYDCFQDTKELLANDIVIASNLPINHISAYELTIEEGTKFTQKNHNNNETFGFFVAEHITQHGFDHYEISNFGNYYCRHNLGYWMLEDYIGIGAGAIGYRDKNRYAPLKDIAQYIASPTQRHNERLTHNEWLTEKIFLGLRSIVGVEKSILPIEILQKGEFLTQHGKLQESDTHFYNSDFFLSDEIALYLMP